MHVGTVDEVDGRYSGPKEPQAIRSQLTMDGMFSWRCDHGKVMACSYGANLPCWGKANASRAPDVNELQYCKEHPDDSIPMAVTGHNAVYSWTCHAGKPVIAGQTWTVDDRGFVKEVWSEIRRQQ
jgi:hypothetical protein